MLHLLLCTDHVPLNWMEAILFTQSGNELVLTVFRSKSLTNICYHLLLVHRAVCVYMRARCYWMAKSVVHKVEYIFIARDLDEIVMALHKKIVTICPFCSTNNLSIE